MTTNDGGNSGAGGPLIATTIVPITINAVADITGDSITTAEDTNASFNVITGTGGATADSFEGSPSVTAINGQPFTADRPFPSLAALSRSRPTGRCCSTLT